MGGAEAWDGPGRGSPLGKVWGEGGHQGEVEEAGHVGRKPTPRRVQPGVHGPGDVPGPLGHTLRLQVLTRCCGDPGGQRGSKPEQSPAGLGQGAGAGRARPHGLLSPSAPHTPALPPAVPRDPRPRSHAAHAARTQCTGHVVHLMLSSRLPGTGRVHPLGFLARQARGPAAPPGPSPARAGRGTTSSSDISLF